MIIKVKRRFMTKFGSLFKRILLPAFLVALCVRIFFGPPLKKSSSLSIDSQEEQLLIPGDALDPFSKGNIDISERSKRIPSKNEYSKSEPIHEENLGIKNSIPNRAEMLKESLNKLSIEKDFQKKLTLEDNLQSKESNHSQVDDDDDIMPKRLKTSWSMAKQMVPDNDKVRFKPHSISNDTVTLTLMSSEDKVFASINKREIYRGINKRGLHVLVVSQYTARVMATRIFDTFQEGAEEDLVQFIDDVTEGRVIIFMVLDDVATSLTWKGRNCLKGLGAKWADKIAYRDMWAMVTRQHGFKMAETFSNVATADTGYEWGGPVFMRTDFDLEPIPVECDWPKTEANNLRRRFCNRFDGYGDLCRCHVKNFDDLFTYKEFSIKDSSSYLSDSFTNQLGIAIIATDRPHNLYRLLVSLSMSKGVNPSRIIIYTDLPSIEKTILARMFNVPIIVTHNFQSLASPIQKIRHKVQAILRDLMGIKFSSSQVPKEMLANTEGKIPFKVDHILLLEEDMVVGVDIFKYLHAMYPLIEKDPSVVAISAFNYHGNREVADRPAVSFRSTDPTNLALLFTKKTAQKDLANNWPQANDENTEWYNGFHLAMKDNKRSIVYPEVSRCVHKNYDGILIKGKVQKDLFSQHKLMQNADYELGAEIFTGMVKDKFEEELKKKVKTSFPLTFDFCKHDLMYTETPYVMYVNYNGENDTDLMYVMKCLGTWSAFPIGAWNDIWQFTTHGHRLIIVGVPASPLSYLKPANYTLITAPVEKEKEKGERRNEEGNTKTK